MFLEALAPDRHSRWVAASRFIDAWFPVSLHATARGFATEHIVAAERRLGLSLPDSLREFYMNFGNLADVWNVQDRLSLPEELQIEDDRLIIVRENQDVVNWFVEIASLGDFDPPVFVSDDSDLNAHHLASPSVSEFALQLLVLNTKFSDRALFRANGQATDDAVVAIEQHLHRLPFADLHWPSFPTRFYGNDSVLAEIDALEWVWITARDTSAFDVVVRLAERAGIQWESIERTK